jgi:arginine/ornithine N-succinyltransferase beta subunit
MKQKYALARKKSKALWLARLADHAVILLPATRQELADRMKLTNKSLDGVISEMRKKHNVMGVGWKNPTYEVRQ